LSSPLIYGLRDLDKIQVTSISSMDMKHVSIAGTWTGILIIITEHLHLNGLGWPEKGIRGAVLLSPLKTFSGDSTELFSEIFRPTFGLLCDNGWLKEMCLHRSFRTPQATFSIHETIFQNFLSIFLIFHVRSVPGGGERLGVGNFHHSFRTPHLTFSIKLYYMGRGCQIQYIDIISSYFRHISSYFPHNYSFIFSTYFSIFSTYFFISQNLYKGESSEFL